MDRIAAALGDAARWRIVALLAERPRSVGELAELTGLRQPQTTKHLQNLARAGLVTVFPLGQRRVYALEAGPLAAFADRLRELAAETEAHEGERDVVARYQAAIEAETAVADRDRWADGRVFAFERLLPAAPDVVWRHWAEPGLLASWWAPPSLTITDCVLEPRPGGRAVLAYRDADGEHRAEGRVRVADEPGRLVFDLAVRGRASFTGHYDLGLTENPAGTRLRLGLRITATTVEAVPAIAGIEAGWDQVLDQLTEVLATERTD
ncbi:metalloregulator ArsR/SmtB family transcription factor [Amycolatopsis sp. OK19-0408]|uniref:Metalloregulator ArsR/SmtB family transcription factor n=1 Tax=Amycolatopsis iheyensis TaxID=2945988 RepID=A0A9X2N716_9PSEU|nr:metalloregulator ArsR/SmtB family transcription factor [Amycolatopsis iheyensis]MCR6483149.1 metalloregulator ArsR/SmtB family transcription factor [Amycolatopsis iheyensis]